MALSEATAWEIRSDGDDNNGGGFVTGATGTDRTQQAAAHATLSAASVINASTNIIDVSAGDYTCLDADVGNTLQITGGTATAGFYRITARSAQQWTLDRAAGTAGQTVVGRMGGALATIHKATSGSVVVTGNTVWVKAGTYARTATTTVAGGLYYTDAARGNRLIGYNTTRGDVPRGANRPLINLGTNTGLIGLNITGNGWRIENIIVDCNDLGTSDGFQAAVYTNFYNCTARQFTARGFDCAGPCYLLECEATDGGSGATGIEMASNGGTIHGCWIHDFAGTGIVIGNIGYVGFNLLSNLTGATTDAIRAGYNVTVINNTIYTIGRDGVRFISFEIAMPILNNIIIGCTGNGINFVSGFGIASPYINYNAFRSNGANLAGLSGTAGSTGSGTAWSLSNVSLTADPFTNAAGNDFSLNGTAGGGAACKAAGIPGVLRIGTATITGYLDVGALQAAAAGGGVSAGGGLAVQFRGQGQ